MMAASLHYDSPLLLDIHRMVTPNLYMDRAFDDHATGIGCQTMIHCPVALVEDQMMNHLHLQERKKGRMMKKNT